jgi:spore coat protein A, manganese oxidase
MNVTRRQLLRAGLVGGAGLMIPWTFRPRRATAQIPGGTLDPSAVPKYQMPLVKPPALRRDGKIVIRGGKNAERYTIAVREFQQQILPPGLPVTTVWSYGPAGDPRTVAEGGAYFYPAFTLETKWRTPAVVTWVNGLGGKQHLLPVDPSLHWANPIGRRDTRPNPAQDPMYWDHPHIGSDGRYTGPVPIVTHVHGAHTTEDSDGYPEAWYLPAGADGDVNYTTGTFHDYFVAKYGLTWAPGTATFTYPNDQRATTLWYHDHTLGMTRQNVYAGPAGFYLIRGGPDDEVRDLRHNTRAILPAPAPGTWPADPFATYYEIPIVVQDRSFNADGSLFYPDERAFFEDLDPSHLQIPFTFDKLGINPHAGGWGLGCDGQVSDVAPLWQPEFFGNMMVVNGFTWPYLDVEQRRYRFRLLNGSNSRFLILQFDDPRVEVWQIGAEGGFLPAPVRLNDYPYPGSSGGATVLMASAERADVIVDFTGVPIGTTVMLLNLGPDEPFGGGVVGDDFDPAHPDTTGQVMQFRVIPATAPDPTTPPQFLRLPPVRHPTGGTSRALSLNEEESANVFVREDDGAVVYDCASPEPFGPAAALLGTQNDKPTPMGWMDMVSENPALGATEVWELYNHTEDAHPIHIHLVQFQVVGRTPFAGGTSVAGQNGPLPWETGLKDTVIAYPGEITRVRARFDVPGFFVWHCHILEHEDNEMMRPYHVGSVPTGAPGT